LESIAVNCQAKEKGILSGNENILSKTGHLLLSVLILRYLNFAPYSPEDFVPRLCIVCLPLSSEWSHFEKRLPTWPDLTILINLKRLFAPMHDLNVSLRQR
jgi:hypothetical protein